MMVMALVSVVVRKRAKRMGFSAVRRDLPALPSLARNSKLSSAERIALPGPESLAVLNGSLFTGLADGRLVRSDDGVQWTTVLESPAYCRASPSDAWKTERKCGRPLGMRSARLNGQDGLVFVDAYKGLFFLTDTLQLLASGFTLLNDCVVQDDTIYFTETSVRHKRRRIFLAATEMRAAGRLLAYKDGRVEVLADKVYMPNGIEIDGRTLIVVSAVSVLRFDLDSRTWLAPLVPVLPGTGDNIRKMDMLPTGDLVPCYWIGLGSKYAKPFSLFKLVDVFPKVRTFLAAVLPYWLLIEVIPKYGLLAVYHTNGTLLRTYQDPTGNVVWLSEAHVFKNHLYLGSWYSEYLARIKIR